MELGRYEDALKAAIEAIGAAPEEPAGYELAGSACVQLKRFEEAESFAMELLSRAPDWATGYAIRGHVRFQKDPRHAEPYYRQALSLEPDTPERHAMLGLALGHMGRLEEAITVGRKGLRLDAENGFVLLVLQQLYRLDEDEEMAEEMGRRALAVNPESSAHHLELGFAMLDRGDRRQAKASFAQSLRLDPRASGDLHDIAYERVRTMLLFRGVYPPVEWPLWLIAVLTPLWWFALGYLWVGFTYLGWLTVALLAIGYARHGLFFVVHRAMMHRMRRGHL